MDYERALNVLGLNPEFTEEELKTAYRTLINKYHPDRYENSKDKDEMIKKTQEINTARDYLKKHHKFHNQNTSQSTSDLEKYIKQKEQELVNLIAFDQKKYQPSTKIINIFITLKLLLDTFHLELTIAKSKADVDYTFEIYMKRIKNKFHELETEFFKENHIDKYNIKENINYDCNLQEFYEQLLKIKEKYSKENIIKKKLEEETIKYKDYAGYKDIKKLIEVCIKNTLITIRNNGFNYTQKDIDNMHQEILECFQIYHNLKQKISKLEEVISGIDDNKIKINYSKLVLDFYAGSSLSDIEKRIAEIEKEIEKYKQEKQQKIAFEQNKQEIENIYKSLIERYSNALKQCNINTDYDAIIYFNQLIKELLTLFRKGHQEFEELDYFKLFNLISFSNVENDHMIIESIITNRSTQSKNNFIFIKKHADYYGQCNSFYIVDTEKMEIGRVRCKEGKNVTKVQYYGHISHDELEGQYMSLEEFLDKSVYVGESRRLLSGNIVELLYQMGEYKLYIEDGIFCICLNTPIIEIDYYKKTSPDEFKDREYVYSQIEKQIRKTVRAAYYDYQNSNKYSFDDINPDNNNKKRK